METPYPPALPVPARAHVASRRKRSAWRAFVVRLSIGLVGILALPSSVWFGVGLFR